MFFFCKQKTAYEMRISDWSSDVCSSDLSLFSTRGRTQTAMAQIRRDAAAYLDSEYTADAGERERIFRRLLGARDHIIALGPKARQQVKNEPEDRKSVG